MILESPNIPFGVYMLAAKVDHSIVAYSVGKFGLLILMNLLFCECFSKAMTFRVFPYASVVIRNCVDHGLVQCVVPD